jgi:(p)ppGpp synthase/HD superfamily hydrolase
MIELTVKECAVFAAEKHAACGQTYRGKPYSYHTGGVADYVRKYAYLLPPHVNPIVVEKAAHGHDLYEDCALSFNDLSAVFGIKAAQYILTVSDVPGEDRVEKMYLTLPKIRRSLGATYLKMCDRAFNSSQDGSMKKTYIAEYYIFRYALYNKTKDIFAPFWEELDKLHGYKQNKSMSKKLIFNMAMSIDGYIADDIGCGTNKLSYGEKNL